MLNEQSLPQKFWCNTVDTLTYVLNRILIRAILGKTPYELVRGRKPTLDYFKLFECKCFILNTKDDLTKFNLKSYEGVFLGYSQNSKACIILNKHTMKIKESLNVTFHETPPPSKTSPFVDYDLDEEEAIKVTEKKSLENDIKDEALEINEVVNIKEPRNHSLENFIRNLNQRTLRVKESKGLWHEKRSFIHSSSSAFGQPSSSHPNDDDDDDDDDDGNYDGTSHASTPIPTHFVNSLSNDIPQIFSNPPNVDPNMEALYSRQTEILNRQVQLRDEQRGGIRSIGKGIKNLLRGKKKK
uniref:Retrovirus-related Pol polyprotein from transposon TNT 1-94 n=1 Tax=Tanacetum cinerariifolium TaxID=118510 RepID=A0A6L2NQR7_TANCI|nr:retrovirus-related Pol polyprotein from transposon TNT 1-94 [Tanacetum cinerariifolium]